jgi:hypothetical protein
MTELAQARAALARGDWQVALDLVDGLGSDGLGSDAAEVLELRAQAAYGNGDLEASVTAWEDLHALSLLAGDDVEAARAAAMIAMYLMMDTGLMAPVRGWLRRAERLLKPLPEVPPHALVAMVRTYERFMCGDTEGARVQSALAIELGERLEVPPAAVIGRVAQARLRIADGDVEEGLSELDEVAVLLMSGDVDPLTTGMMYCELICAAQGLALHHLAREWTEVMERWRHGVAYGGINGRCRVHRAEILRISGPCDLAEEEALGACAELRPWMRREFGWPLVELGNIRLRRGDLVGAEEAFLSAHEHAWSPYPGLALLRLAQGDVAGAVGMIADAIEHPLDVPWKERPPFGDLRLAPLLDAQAEIAAAAADLETVRRAALALRAIADKYPSPSLAAGASLAEGRAALLAGETGAAIAACAAAVAHWSELGAPYEAAAARVVLGEAQARAGNPARARQEWAAARSAFARFGAVTRAEHAAGLVAARPAAGPAARPAARPAAPTGVRVGHARPATFRRVGDHRMVCFDGVETVLVDLKGFRYLERLLADPGREFHVLDLLAVEHGTVPAVAPRDGADLAVDAGAGLPVIDDRARAAYRRRLTEVEEDIEDAVRMNDPGRRALAERDRDFLVAELAGAVGLGGRRRLTAGSAERARTSVTRTLRYAVQRLTEHHPDLGTHLGRAVRTGTYCGYRPDPLSPVTWELSG